MKKHFNLAAAVLLFCVAAACSNLDSDIVTAEAGFSGDPGLIRISSVGLFSEPTKAFAGETTLSTLKQNGFRCFATVSGSGLEFIDDDVRYDGTSFVFSGGDYYYPTDGALDFHAVYPKSLVLRTDGSRGNRVFLDYANDGRQDLVLASCTAHTAGDGDVALEFRHLLATVRTTVRGLDADVDYRLKSLVLVTSASDRYYPASGSWEFLGEYLEENLVSGPVAVSGTYGEVGHIVACVPHETQYKISWDCLDRKTGSVVGSYSCPVRLDAYLTAGYHSTFNLSLPNSNASEVVLDVSVESWESASHDIDVVEFAGRN